jgi:type IV pilus assembly protein PilA
VTLRDQKPTKNVTFLSLRCPCRYLQNHVRPRFLLRNYLDFFINQTLSGNVTSVPTTWHADCIRECIQRKSLSLSKSRSFRGKEIDNETFYSKGLHPHRIDDRGGDYWYFGRDRDSAVPKAIALPAYQDYTVRSRVSEGMVLASSAKLAVAENAANGKNFDSGYVPVLTGSGQKSVDTTAINTANGVITVTYKTNVAPAATNSVTFVPTSGGAALVGTATSSTVPTGPAITWVCTGGTLVAKYRPAECRA